MINDGSGARGWAILLGIPATITAFATTGPFGMVMLVFAALVYWHGCRLRREYESQQAGDRVRPDSGRSEESIRAERSRQG